MFTANPMSIIAPMTNVNFQADLVGPFTVFLWRLAGDSKFRADFEADPQGKLTEAGLGDRKYLQAFVDPALALQLVNEESSWQNLGAAPAGPPPPEVTALAADGDEDEEEIEDEGGGTPVPINQVCIPTQNTCWGGQINIENLQAALEATAEEEEEPTEEETTTEEGGDGT